jgi:predicted  nucleic acid-binding Zn-ribbon protein
MRRRPRRWLVFAIASVLLFVDVVPIVDASPIFLDRKLAVVAAAGIFGGRRGGSAIHGSPSSLEEIPPQHGAQQPPPPPPQLLGSRNMPGQQLQKPSDRPLLASVPLLSENASDQIETVADTAIPNPPVEERIRQPEALQPVKMSSSTPNPSNQFWSSQQQQQNIEIHSYQEQLFYLHRDLEASYIREQQLLADLHNLTAIASEAKQREKLHMHQLDVLTERVIDVEMAAAHDHNLMLEYQFNCTELFKNLDMQQRSTDEWREKCESLMELHEADEARIRDLQEKVKSVAREAESLASTIEKHRLSQQGTIKRNRKMGFFAWLFSFGASLNDEEDDYREVYDEARSSLLAALQSERNCVSELEAALVSLQQNNSAISEQVQSRDQIIDELNNRIAVFEEDKVVLKAALRQLQMEMNDEAPKTQKLVNDLAHAQSEVERLSDEIDSLMDRHKAEISNMQLILNEKVKELKAAESNLTIIGTYVEKLEERLADFTVARREVEERELACSELEKKVAESENQRESMQDRIQELGKEHDELKALLSELAEERSKLLESAKLSSDDRSTLEQTVQRLRQSYAKLDNEGRDLREQLVNSQLQLNHTEGRLNETMAAADELLRRLDQCEYEKQELRSEVERTLQAQREWQEKLDLAELTKHALESRIEELESSLQAALSEYITYSEETKRSMEELEREIQETRMTPAETDLPSSPDHFKSQAHTIDSLTSFNDRDDPIGNSSRSGQGTEFSNITENMIHALVPMASVDVPRRKVPLRKIRKFFAKATGVHGLFLKPTQR